MTSPKVQYIFIGDNEIRDRMVRLMPKEATVLIFDADTVSTDASVDKDVQTRLVYFTNTASGITTTLSAFTSTQSTALHVDVDSPSPQLTFFEKFASPSVYPFIEDELLLGTIYASSGGFYECTLENVMAKAQRVSQVYRDRATALSSSYTGICSTLMNDGSSNFNELDGFFGAYPSQGQWSGGNFHTFYTQTKSDLHTTNQDASLQSCAYLY